MNLLTTAIASTCIALAAGTVCAQDASKKNDAMSKSSMTKAPTMQECKDHMAILKKDSMKKDEAMMKMDAACSDMMKKDGMSKSSSTAAPAGSMASGAMKK